MASIGVDARRPELVKALVELGKTLGLVVVAEGVEQAVQLDYLCSIGCERAQGYYFAKPLPADQMEKFLPTVCPNFVIEGEETAMVGAR